MKERRIKYARSRVTLENNGCQSKRTGFCAPMEVTIVGRFDSIISYCLKLISSTRYMKICVFCHWTSLFTLMAKDSNFKKFGFHQKKSKDSNDKRQFIDYFALELSQGHKILSKAFEYLISAVYT